MRAFICCLHHSGALPISLPQRAYIFCGLIFTLLKSKFAMRFKIIYIFLLSHSSVYIVFAECVRRMRQNRSKTRKIRRRGKRSEKKTVVHNAIAFQINEAAKGKLCNNNIIMEANASESAGITWNDARKLFFSLRKRYDQPQCRRRNDRPSDQKKINVNFPWNYFIDSYVSEKFYIHAIT